MGNKGSNGWGRMLAVLMIWLVACALPAAAAPDVATDNGGALTAPRFTITRIEPDAANNRLLVTFNRPVDIKLLQEHLRVFPYASVWWHRSKQLTPTKVLLQGRFQPGRRYVLSLPEDFAVAGVPYRKGVNSFVMPDLPPRVVFAEPGTVIERDSRQMVHLKTTNCSRVLLRTLSVPPLLLPLALAQETGTAPCTWDQLLDDLQREAGNLRDLARQKPELEPFLKSLDQHRQLYYTAAEKNREKSFSLPLTFRARPELGALQLVRLESMDTTPPAPPVSQVFRVTDLGLSAKVGASDLLVWVTSLDTGSPLESVSILAFSDQNEIFPLGKTSANGVLLLHDRDRAEALVRTGNAGFSFDQRPFRSSRMRFILAATSTDVSYLAIGPKHTLTPEGITLKPGRWRDHRLLRGTLFTERGIYRPNDTVHFKAYLRRYQNGKIVSPDGPCSVRVSNAKGEEFYRRDLILSTFGSAWGDVTIEPYYPLGTYTITLASKHDPEVTASTTFQVQEFRPPRHYALIQYQQAQRPSTAYVNRKRTEQLVRIVISGRYYAGGPVKNGQARWKIYHTDVERAVSGMEDFTFGYPTDEDLELIETGEAILDERGQMTVEFPLDQDVVAGKRGLLVSATIIDFDGRAATSKKTFQTDPDYLVGISRHPAEIRVDTRQQLKLVVLDRNRQPIPAGRIEATVLSRSGTYVRTRNEQGNVDWYYRDIWRRQYGSQLALEGGVATFAFDFASGGSYLVSFTYRDAEGNPFSSSTLFKVGGDPFWTAYDNREKDFDALQLQADQKAYQPGMTAAITAAGNRPIASALLTLEQGEVLSYRVLSGDDLKNPLSIPIRSEFMPNLFVSVLAVTPRGEFPLYASRYDSEAPSFLFGTVNLPVQQQPDDLLVDINRGQPELAARPGAELKLDLQVTGSGRQPVRTELAVAVINEAVLALTGFQTPNLEPLRRFDGPLGVFTSEVRAALLQQTPFHNAHTAALSGGGGAEPGIPVTDVRKDFRPVAYFNPAMVTDDSGHAEVTFQLPDTMTQYRIYAVACDPGSRFGSAVRHLTVSKPFYLEPGLPRFFYNGDTFRFPVEVFNHTESTAPCELRITGNDALQIAAPDGPTEIPKNASARIPVSGKAVSSGTGKILAAARLADHRDALQLSLPVANGFTMGSELRQGSFRRNLLLQLPVPESIRDLLRSGSGSDAVTTTLEISGSPLLQLAAPLHYLLTYPYGCVEQTSSGVLALAGLRGLVNSGLIPGIEPGEMDRYLSKGISRLLSMQTDSGGFAYWPGYHSPHPWGTLYAGAALALSKKNGFEVAPEPLKRALSYLKETGADEKQSLLYRAFTAFVLGLFDPATPVPMNLPPLREMGSMPTLTQLLRLLAEGQQVAISEEQVAALVQKSRDDLRREESSEIFNGRYLESAFSLLLALEAAPQSAAPGEAARILLAGIERRGMWSSSSDTGWGLYALGRYYQGRARAAQPFHFTWSLSGRAKHQEATDPYGTRTIEIRAQDLLPGPVMELSADTDEDIYYRLSLNFPRLDYEKTGHEGGLRVWKKIENMDAQKSIRVGDMVRLTVGIETDGKPKRFVILDDPLPAGLVAINSALSTEEPIPGNDSFDRYNARYWNSDGTYRFRPNFFEIRDRRVLAFRDTLWRGAYRFVYYARAVCEGTFKIPSSKAELMYQPEVNGFSPAGSLQILAAPGT